MVANAKTEQNKKEVLDWVLKKKKTKMELIFSDMAFLSPRNFRKPI